jgi:hypothetical protein
LKRSSRSENDRAGPVLPARQNEAEDWENRNAFHDVLRRWVIEASNAEGDGDFDVAQHRVRGVLSTFNTDLMYASDFSEEWLDGKVRFLRKRYPTVTLTPQECSLFINEFRNSFAHVQGLFGQVFDTVIGALGKIRRARGEGGAVDSSSDISNPSDPTGMGYPLSISGSARVKLDASACLLHESTSRCRCGYSASWCCSGISNGSPFRCGRGSGCD